MLDKVCAFCTKSTWNPYTEQYDDKEKLFCGVSSGFDTRAEALDGCGLKVTKSKRNAHLTKKREEYQILTNSRREHGNIRRITTRKKKNTKELLK